MMHLLGRSGRIKNNSVMHHETSSIGININYSITNHTTGFEIYMRSIFCLQPPGDTVTRKGMYDSFVVGCIPVTFNKNILQKTAPWWFTKSVESATTVNLDFQSDKTNHIIRVLEEIPKCQLVKYSIFS